MIPAVENTVNLGISEIKPPSHEIVNFGDQTHQTVFDAVVNHLDVVSRRSWSEPGGTRFGIHLCRDCLKDWSYPFVGFARAAGHDAGAVACAVFAPGDAYAEEFNPMLSQRFGPQVRV